MIQTIGNSDNIIQFTGQVADPETGLDYFGARYYDPTTGGFISQDSNLGANDIPITLNRYIYAEDNPLGYTDPTGNQARNLDDEIPPPEPLEGDESTAAPAQQPDLGELLRNAPPMQPSTKVDQVQEIANGLRPMEGGSTVESPRPVLLRSILSIQTGFKLATPCQ